MTSGTPSAEPDRARREVADGFRYVAGVPFLWVMIAISSLLLMVQIAPFQVLLPDLVKTQWHQGVGGYGLLMSVMGPAWCSARSPSARSFHAATGR